MQKWKKNPADDIFRWFLRRLRQRQKRFFLLNLTSLKDADTSKEKKVTREHVKKRILVGFTAGCKKQQQSHDKQRFYSSVFSEFSVRAQFRKRDDILTKESNAYVLKSRQHKTPPLFEMNKLTAFVLTSDKATGFIKHRGKKNKRSHARGDAKTLSRNAERKQQQQQQPERETYLSNTLVLLRSSGKSS